MQRIDNRRFFVTENRAIFCWIMPFEPIRRILPKAIQSAGISRQVNAARVIEDATGLIKNLWGEKKAAYVQPVSFSEGVLKIRALAPIALQELRLWETRIQNELNRSLGSAVVKRLQLVDR